MSRPATPSGPASDAATAPVVVADGLVVRDAVEQDRADVVALNRTLFGVQDASAVDSIFGEGTDIEWLVAARADDGRVAAACCRIPHRFELDGIAVPGSQIEFVTTDPSQRGKGLVRALLSAHHRRAAAVGELLQLIGGIPYFYRKLGYGYAVDYPPLVVVDTRALPAPDPSMVQVRPVRPADLAGLVELDRRRPRSGLLADRDEAVWRRWLARTAGEAARSDPGAGLGLDDAWEALLVAERDERPVGWLRIQVLVDEGKLHLLPGAVADLDVGLQLLATVGRITAHLATVVLARPVEVLTVDRAGSPWARVLAGVGHRRDEPSGIYGRTPDEVGLLRTLRPVLSSRVAASELAADRGELVLSLYERGIRLAWEGGEVTAIEPCAADPDPFDHGQVGVAPDWFPALVLGRWGASGLAERIDDVVLGRQAAVMDVLFPARPNDLVADL